MLSEDQKQCFRFVNIHPGPVLVLNAFAGTGKTFFLGLLSQAILPDLRDPGKGMVIWVPSRDLRDELLQNPDTGLSRDDLGCTVLWLGREKEGRPGAQVLWEKQLEEQIAKHRGTRLRT